MKRRLTVALMGLGLSVVAWIAMAGYNPQIVELDLDIVYLNADDPTETNPGGFVCVGGRREIKITSESFEAGSKVRLSWDTARIQVEDAAGTAVVADDTYGAGVDYKDYPANSTISLYVKGTAVSGELRDVAVTLEALHNTPALSDTVRFTVVDVEVIRVIPSYFADAESHVPVVFRVLCPEVLSVSDLSNPRVNFWVDPSGYAAAGFTGTDVSLYKGEFITGILTEPNVFTALIKESAFDPVQVANDISENVAYAVLVKVKGVDCYSAQLAAERFGDWTIPIYEAKVGATAGNGRYATWPQPRHKKAMTKSGYLTLDDGTKLDLPRTGWSFSDLHFDKDVDGTDNFELNIKYKTGLLNAIDLLPMRFSLVDERRQGYVQVFYGRKTVDGIPNVIDLTKDVANVRVAAFTGQVPNGSGTLRKFTYEWGQTSGYELESQSTFGDHILYAYGLADVACTTYSIASMWRFASWQAWIAEGLIGLGSGVASAILDPPTPGKDWASVTMHGGLVIRDKEGNEDRSRRFFSPGNTPSTWTDRLAPGAPTGNNHENWDIDTKGATIRVCASDTVTAFVAGSLEAGSPCGVEWFWWGSQRHALEAKLALDIGADDTIQMTE